MLYIIWALSLVAAFFVGRIFQSMRRMPRGNLLMFKVKNDHPEVEYSIDLSNVKAKDAEGEEFTPDEDDLNIEVYSTDTAVVDVETLTETSGKISFGGSGVASVIVEVRDNDNNLLASEAKNFTVTHGDPASVSGIAVSFSGLTEEPEAPSPEPAPEGGGSETGGGEEREDLAG